MASMRPRTLSRAFVVQSNFARFFFSRPLDGLRADERGLHEPAHERAGGADPRRGQAVPPPPGPRGQPEPVQRRHEEPRGRHHG